MKKRERVLAALAGKPVDRLPAGFWLHFPEAAFFGDASVAAHLVFFEKTGTDIMKIMNENLVPAAVPIRTAADWKNIRPFHKNDPFIQNQLEITRRILDRVGGEGLVLQTIHGVVASAWHARGGSAGYETGADMLVHHYREDPDAVTSGWQSIAEAQAILAEASLDLGVDGIYYAALGGENTLFDDAEFSHLIRPLDLEILTAAAGPGRPLALHICKDHIHLDRYLGYPCDIINWATHEEGNLTLSAGAALFPDKAILGGLDDRAGVLVDGSEGEIRAAVSALRQQMAGRRFILGADCTLPTEIDYGRIRCAVTAAK